MSILVRLRSSTGNEVTATKGFVKATEEIGQRLEQAMYFIGGELENEMRSRASGQLQQRTRKLSRAFFHKVIAENGGMKIVLITGVARRAFYASFQDQGIRRKTVDVRGYTRGGRGRARRVGAAAGFVDAYRREMYLDPKPFIGVSLEAMRAQIVENIQMAIHGVLP